MYCIKVQTFFHVYYIKVQTFFYVDSFFGNKKKKQPELQLRLDTDQVSREKQTAPSASVFQFTQKAMTLHVSDI